VVSGQRDHAPSRLLPKQQRRARGRRLTDAGRIAWIKGLAIPPAWTDVWISPIQRGHSSVAIRSISARTSTKSRAARAYALVSSAGYDATVGARFEHAWGNREGRSTDRRARAAERKGGDKVLEGALGRHLGLAIPAALLHRRADPGNHLRPGE
jgi:hypothetical protein